MSSSKILLVLGAGKNIGFSLAKSFSTAGYKVALVSRSAPNGETTPEGYLQVKGDLGKPASIPSIFATVKEKLGVSPSVVVYNAANISPAAKSGDPFSVPIEHFENDMTMMNTSAFVAAREAVAGFETISESVPKSFIYTGNIQASVILPVADIVTLGVGKSAAVYWVGVAALMYKEKGYSFYFAEERTPEGQPMGNAISGSAAAEFYLPLAEGKTEAPWYATFVNGKGFVSFPEATRH